MKFLYLKETDVLGPLGVEELVREVFFSDDLLVCPEDEAENHDSWKPARDYPEFKIVLGQAVFASEKENKSVEKTSDQDNSPKQELSQTNKEQSQGLPPLEDTKTESSADFRRPDFRVNGGGGIYSVTGKVNPQNGTNPQDHSFDISKKEDNLLEDLPSESLLGNGEQSKKISQIVVGKTAADMPAGKDHYVSIPEEPLQIQETDSLTLDKNNFLEISNNKIISSSDGRVTGKKKNDLIFILSFIAITIVAIALCMAFLNMAKEGKMQGIPSVEQEQKGVAEETVPVSQNSLQEGGELAPQISVQESAPLEQKPITSEDQAIDIVKNTVLSSKGKTIESYFKEVYGTEYKYSWSAKPFTDKTYIVEFFASQVRSEPFVYLFRVDLEEQKITGALNNITLDLLA